jgi:hypothetical protein
MANGTLMARCDLWIRDQGDLPFASLLHRARQRSIVLFGPAVMMRCRLPSYWI